MGHPPDIEGSDLIKESKRLLWTVVAVPLFIITTLFAIFLIQETFYYSSGVYRGPGLLEILMRIPVALLSPIALACWTYSLWSPRENNTHAKYVWTAIVLVLFGLPSSIWFFQYIGHVTATYDSLTPEVASSLRYSSLRIAIYPLAVCSAWLYLIWRRSKNRGNRGQTGRFSLPASRGPRLGSRLP